MSERQKGQGVKVLQFTGDPMKAGDKLVRESWTWSGRGSWLAWGRGEAQPRNRKRHPKGNDPEASFG